MGTIYQDCNTAVAGEMGKRPAMVPVSVTVSRGAKPVESYQMQMVHDTLLSPLLLQMAVFSAIDATERTVGAGSIRVTGQIEFQNGTAPLRINNMYAADNGSPMLASLSAAVPVAFVMQGGFESLQLKKVSLQLEAFDQKKQLTIDSITTFSPARTSRREAVVPSMVSCFFWSNASNWSETFFSWSDSKPPCMTKAIGTAAEREASMGLPLSAA